MAVGGRKRRCPRCPEAARLFGLDSVIKLAHFS
jgi:hypothetical protein